MPSKRQTRLKKVGFKAGNTPWNKGKDLNFTKTSTSEKCSRLSKTSFDRRVKKNDNQVLFIEDVDGIPVEGRILRPKQKSPDIVDKCLTSAESNPTGKNDGPHVFVPWCVEDLFNTEIRKHLISNPKCEGFLRFDIEHKIKWGNSSRQRLICQDCGYLTEYYKMYEVIESKKRGAKAAKINITSQIGIMTTPLGNKGFRDIQMASNIDPPSRSGMQKISNKVSDVVEEINRDSMRDIRKQLFEENILCGLKDPQLVRAESDGKFNNARSNVGSTPFQAGTQVAQSMCENNTTDKKVIGLFLGNKLCCVASRMRGKGIEVVCPNHEGVCTANIAEDASIGNEAAYTKECATEVLDYLKISHLTTDGDSKAVQGVKEVHGPNVETLRDVLHLSRTMGRAIMKCTFSSSMLHGENKSNQKSRFSLDIRHRCVAELNQSFKIHNGELYKIKEHMPEVIKTIIMCYKGYCGEMCKVNSYVCAGLQSNHWQKQFIAYGETCKMTCDDELKVEECIKILLGPKTLNLVRFLTSTQKCEALNRKISRCNPKNVTYSRNFKGRVHIAVHLANHRFANSILQISSKLGAPITSKAVLKKLKQTDLQELYFRWYRQQPSTKCSRAFHRNRRFRLHAQIRYTRPVTYAPGLSDPKYDKKCVKRGKSVDEHGYAKPKRQ